jgi:hypothetical protein
MVSLYKLSAFTAFSRVGKLMAENADGRRLKKKEPHDGRA